MSPSAASSRTALSRSPSQLPRRDAKRRNRHTWTDVELNLLSHLRYLHHWSFKQIQKSYFPSLSPSALLGAYWRLSTEDRVRRASKVAGPITTPRNTTRDGPSHPPPLPRPFSRSGNSAETSTLSLPSSATGGQPVISNSGITNCYNLRPNRPTTFAQRKPRYLVDRRRFPHFSKSYRYHLNLHGLPDRDYAPPSRTPTPDSSDRSPSVVSSLPSIASSLELFGLEARSIHSSDRNSSVTSSLPSDISSPEFFSSEERPSTPWLISRNLSSLD
jgi:hypothetical protein